MSYAFEFSNESCIGYVSGFKSSGEAMSKLEEFAKGHCKEGDSSGKLFEIKKRKPCLVSEYRIFAESGSIRLEKI